MPCCGKDVSFDDLFKAHSLGYIDMEVELIKDYGDLKAGDDISDLGNAQKKLLLNIKAAKIKVSKNEKSKDKRGVADSSKSKS